MKSAGERDRNVNSKSRYSRVVTLFRIGARGVLTIYTIYNYIAVIVTLRLPTKKKCGIILYIVKQTKIITNNLHQLTEVNNDL